MSRLSKCVRTNDSPLNLEECQILVPCLRGVREWTKRIGRKYERLVQAIPLSCKGKEPSNPGSGASTEDFTSFCIEIKPV